MKKIKWYDWMVYRLFHWRWNKILSFRPDLREIAIAHLKAYDVLNEGDKIKVNVTIERIGEN